MLKTDKISKYFTLGDLTKTSQGTANMPNSFELNNLKLLSKILDELYEKIGPFRIESAFRSVETQNILRTKTAQAASKSFHSLGMAADIVPTSKPVKQYMAEILDGEFKMRLGEIFVKKNTIHLSLATETKRAVAGYVDSNDKYIRWTPSELSDFIKNNKIAVAVAGVSTLAIGLAVGGALILSKKGG